MSNTINIVLLLQPSKPGRSWFISPYSEKNPLWTIPAASIPAILALVLIFMDQQITAVIVNRKENKLVVSCKLLSCPLCVLCFR